MHTARRGEGTAHSRSLDADLIEAVAARLAGSATFTRLVAGLEVLRRTYDVGSDERLSVAEVTRLTSYVDTVGVTEQVQEELRFLISTLNLLADEIRDDRDFEGEKGSGAGRDDDNRGPRPGRWWAAAGGLTVITTFHSRQRRKDILDRVVFHRLLHDLGDARTETTQRTLVVAGADEIGLDSLEEMARQCARIGVRLVFMLERLRSDLKELLGHSDSAAVLMRLGNAQDAAGAAEFIGRGHKLVLSQITEQVGQTFTRGTATTDGTTEGTSSTSGTSTTRGSSSSFAGLDHPGSGTTSRSHTTSDSFTTSRSRSWQKTVNLSEADSVTEGETYARTYEFEVEPTTIQSLPTTAFVMVESPASGRRVVLGDCNPGIALLDQVADTPRRL